MWREAAFLDIYGQHALLARREIRRWIWGCTPEDREDLEQEVWQAVWRGLPHFQHRAAVSTWLTSIIRHVVVSWLRRRQCAARLQAQLGNGLAAEAVLEQSSEADRPIRRLVVAEALAGIDFRFEEVLRLRFFEHLSDAEAAKRLALPLGTVKRRSSSGIKHLREAWAEDRSGGCT